MLMIRFAVLLLLLSVTLGERFYFTVSGNALDIFAVAFVAVTSIVWVRDSLRRQPAKPYHAMGLNTIGPLFLLLIILPLVGAIIGWYEITILYAWMIVAVPLGIISLGRASRLHGLQIRRIVFGLILVHGVYGLGQTLVRTGILSEKFWPTREWDLASQHAMSEAYVITGRSTGLFLNANAFGFWSCSAILVGAVLFEGWRRNVALILGILGVIGSQSRTAWVGLTLLLVVLLINALRNRHVAKKLVFSGIIALPIVIIGWQTRVLAGLLESSLVERLNSALDVASGGVDADRNLSLRVDAWKSVADFGMDYPTGTFGPPQALYGSFIDNQYVSFMLQGGPLLVVAYILALLSPLVLARRGVPLASAIGLASGLLAVVSLTMAPFELTSASALIWLLVAEALSREPGTRGRSVAGPGISVSDASYNCPRR